MSMQDMAMYLHEPNVVAFGHNKLWLAGECVTRSAAAAAATAATTAAARTGAGYGYVLT